MSVIWLPNLALQSEWNGMGAPMPIITAGGGILTEAGAYLTDESGNEIIQES